MSLTCALLIINILLNVGANQFKPCDHERAKPDGRWFCEQTCCHDKLKCDNLEGSPAYLGADTLMRIPHAGNDFGISVTYRYMNLHFKTVSKYLKPQDYVYSGWETGHYNSMSKKLQCSSKNNKTGSVTAMVYYGNRFLLVCEDMIFSYRTFFREGVTQLQNEVETVQRGAGCSLKKFGPLCFIKGDHNETLNLIDAFSLPDPQGKEWLVGFFGESQVNQSEKFSREYKVLVYRVGQLVFQTKRTGELSAIDLYHINKNRGQARGIIFTNSGVACPFDYKIENNPQYNFEETLDKSMCRSLQTYLACPQAWCVDAFMDASFTVVENGTEKIYITIFRDLWILPAKRLPMDVPRVGNRIRLWSGGYEDATGTALQHHSYVPNLKRNAEAAFRVTHRNTEYVFVSYSDARNSRWSVVKGRKGVAEISVFREVGTLPNAAWYDDITNRVYIFKSSNFFTYELKGQPDDPKSWKYSTNGSLNELGLFSDGQTEDAIEAVITMNGTNYVFNQRFRYYEIKMGQNKVTVGSAPKLVQKHFFRLLSQCYYNDFNGYNALMKRHHERTPVKVVFQRKFVPYPTKGTQRRPGQSNSSFAVVIVITGFVVCITGLTLMYIWGSDSGEKKYMQSKKQQRKRTESRRKTVKRRTSF